LHNYTITKIVLNQQSRHGQAQTQAQQVQLGTAKKQNDLSHLTA